MTDTIAVVGLGLIGGSLAKAIKKYTEAVVIGFDTDDAVVAEALRCGAIDTAGDPEDLGRAGLVFLCLYPAAAVAFAEQNGPSFQKGAVICDVSGIKTWVCRKMPPIAEKYGFVFIGAHPMAGKERNGFAASDAVLFKNASFLVVPCGAPEPAVQELSTLALAIGFGGVVVTTPEEHDRMIAFTSQLPHVLACSYVLSPCCPRHKGFSAGSYRDVSRVARINEVLWTELFLENKEPLVEELDTLITHISDIRNAISQGEKERLQELLKKGRKIKEALGE